jgi:tetratricopeptide (TPR) repeat protein
LEAIDSYTQAINADANYAEAFYNRGLVNLMSNRYPQGCEDLQEAERLGYERATLKINAFCDL